MRVGIVNDLRLATEALRRVVSSDPNLEIAWTAADGQEAVDRCAEDLPDVVLMDLVMPVMNGAEATREIMSRFPCPVLVVTATVSGNYGLVCEALGYGAYDAVCTPMLGDSPPEEAGASLLAKLKSVDRIRRDMASAPHVPKPVPPADALPSGIPTRRTPLVAIGSSTGGPQALERILSVWPEDFPASVVVVQHIAAEFAAPLAQWLQERSAVKVRPAADGEELQPGVVLVAATNDHLVMRNDRRLAYRVEPTNTPYRPSVDTLFESLDQHWHDPAVAVVLTGIGRDGATGLLKLRQRGWHTIAQDEKTSVVYGMPMAAAQLGAAKRILPIDEIAEHIAGHVRRLV